MELLVDLLLEGLWSGEGFPSTRADCGDWAFVFLALRDWLGLSDGLSFHRLWRAFGHGLPTCAWLLCPHGLRHNRHAHWLPKRRMLV